MPEHIRSAWLRTLGAVVLALLGATVAGALVGHAWAGLALAALAALAWHYWRLRRVLRRLTARQRWEPPRGEGVWNELDRLLFRSQHEMRGRKRRLLDMLRTYRAAAAALPDAVVVVDRNSQRVQWFNEAATTLLGLHHPRDLDAPVVERLQPLPLAQWLATGRNAEPMLDAPSPADPQLRLNLRLIPYSEDYWLLVARDVSKLLRLEQVRQDFVANVSHELRTPVAVIRANAETLLAGAKDDPAIASKLINGLHRNAERLAALVGDLLDLSRLEAGHFRLDIAPVPVHPKVTHTVDLVEVLATSRGVTVDNKLPEDLVVQADPRALEQIFVNLIDNAIKYARANGKVELACLDEGDMVRIEVRDDGAGIPEKHRARVFERFYRADSSRSREAGGTGLGLSIVKHLVERMGGSVGVEPNTPQGSIFWLRLPRSPG